MNAVHNIHTHLNLNGNEVRNVRLEGLPSDPDPVEGGVYFNLETGEFRFSDGTAWKSLLGGFWKLDDDGNLVTDKTVIVPNLIVRGDLSTEAKGSDPGAAGTILGVTVNGFTYGEDYIKAGILDLSEAFNNITVDLSGYASIDYVDNKIAGLINGAPSTLDTLKEIAFALAENADIVTALDAAIGSKADKEDVDGLLKKYLLLEAESQTIKGNLRIEGNLIIAGDTSSEKRGTDAGAAGGIIGVKVGDAEYTDITAGILDMTEAFEGLDVDVDLSDYYTNEETDAKIAESLIPYAKIADVGSTYATKASLETLQGEVDNIESILGMDEEAEGIINTWNEVKAFLDGYSSSDDLAAILSTMNADIAKRALDSDLDTLAGRVGANELAISDNAGNIKKNFDAIGVLESNKANWGTTLAHYGITDAYTKVNVDDLLKKYLLLEAESQTIKGNLKIEGNLIIAGDMSSEGNGGNSGADGTVIGVVVNGTQYADETNGMLDLSLLMNQYALATAIPTSLPASDVYAWAKKSSLALADVPDLSSKYLSLSGGTLTASKREVLYLNTTTAYCDLILQINKVDKAALSYDAAHGVYVYNCPSGKYIGVKDDGTPYYNNGSYNTLYHTGNFNPANYLPLNGGILEGIATNVLTLNSLSSSDAGVYLRMEHNSVKVGEFGCGWGLGTYMLANNHVIKLLNDGTAYVDDSKIVTAKGKSSQFIKGDGSLDSNKYVKTYGENEGGNGIDLNTIVNASIIGVSNATNGPYSSGNAWASLITMPYRTAYANTTVDFAAQLLIPNGDGASPNMYFRTGLRTSWNAWRKVLDNENFSAHALSLADGGTVAGSVTFSKTVQISNEIQLGNNKAVLFRNASGKQVNGIFVGPDDILYVGYDNISSVAFRFPVTISSELTTTGNMFAPYLFLGKGKEGIYATDTGIHWHNSEHAYTASLISLAKNSITLSQPTTVSGSLKATSLRSASIGIECAADGTTGGYGSEINRFGSSLYLQTREGNLYLSHADGTTAIRGNVTIDKDMTITGAIIGKDGIDLCGLGASAGSSRLFLTTGTFRPWGDDAEKISLGTQSVRWHTLFAKDTNLSGALSVEGASALTGAVTMSSTLTVSQKLQCNGPIFGYMYGSNNNAAAFIFDKPGSNYTGIGSDGTANTIRLSACDGAGTWVNYTQNWKFYGNIIMTGDLSSTSDMRLKQRIEDVILDLKTMAEMPIFTFRWKDGSDDRLHLGSSAQYWEKPAPWLVMGDETKTLNYAVLGVAGIKSLAVTAVDHETRIKMLERKVSELETENRRLRYGN